MHTKNPSTSVSQAQINSKSASVSLNPNQTLQSASELSLQPLLLLADTDSVCPDEVPFRFKLGLIKYGPAISGLDSSSASGSEGGGSAATGSKAAEKTTFDIKLEKFDVSTKIKIIKEVRTFRDLRLKKLRIWWRSPRLC
ncbi:hypothetical protein NE237_027919 [Protea cynaroides]|uniref:Uncharacterized protein n=1 Tax=Protea cynaroides TaxID=273540 RepID=A0A9Q0GS94_9MAGN|nr:hypothetical protein NE237_027919 [Protea cynaroides]